MPNYTYKSRDPSRDCDTCVPCFTQLEPFSSERLSYCPDCDLEVYVAILPQNVQVTIKAKHRAGFQDYREDLARFKGDPEAFVNSPQQVERLIEKRQRQGWVKRDEDWADLHNTMPKGSLMDAPPVDAEVSKKLLSDSLDEAIDELRP